VNEPTLDAIRKRILLFYFATGVNLFMAVVVSSADGATISSGMRMTMALVFIAFALVNLYMAKKFRTRWNQLARHAQAQGQAKPESTGSPQK
jgi:hypothetical protein